METINILKNVCLKYGQAKVAKDMGIKLPQLNRWVRGKATPRRSSLLMINSYLSKIPDVLEGQPV